MSSWENPGIEAVILHGEILGVSVDDVHDVTTFKIGYGEDIWFVECDTVWEDGEPDRGGILEHSTAIAPGIRPGRLPEDGHPFCGNPDNGASETRGDTMTSEGCGRTCDPLEPRQTYGNTPLSDDSGSTHMTRIHDACGLPVSDASGIDSEFLFYCPCCDTALLPSETREVEWSRARSGMAALEAYRAEDHDGLKEIIERYSDYLPEIPADSSPVLMLADVLDAFTSGCIGDPTA